MGRRVHPVRKANKLRQSLSKVEKQAIYSCQKPEKSMLSSTRSRQDFVFFYFSIFFFSHHPVKILLFSKKIPILGKNRFLPKLLKNSQKNPPNKFGLTFLFKLNHFLEISSFLLFRQ